MQAERFELLGQLLGRTPPGVGQRPLLLVRRSLADRFGLRVPHEDDVQGAEAGLHRASLGNGSDRCGPRRIPQLSMSDRLVSV